MVACEVSAKLKYFFFVIPGPASADVSATDRPDPMLIDHRPIRAGDSDGPRRVSRGGGSRRSLFEH